MSRVFLTNIDMTDNQVLNLRLQVLTSDPSPVEAKIYYNDTANEIRYYDGSVWKALGTAGAGGPPSGAASGDLTGSYPNPQIAAGVIVDADVATANKDGLAATPSLRTLGTGAQQAAAGNDSRFTDSRPPTGAAGGDLAGSTYPNPVIAALAVTDAKVAVANKDGAAATPSLRTLGLGAAQALAGNTRLDQITAPTAAVSLNSQKITNLADPTANTDAANKQYVDLTAQGFDFKDAARIVATTNVTQSGLSAIDGVTPVANNRILCAGQTTQSQNGLWLAQSGAWTRASDADASGELTDGTLVPVAEGTANADSLWICTGVGTAPWVPGTNVSTWTKFSSVSDLVAGAGLTKTGTTIDLVSATGDATVGTDSFTINSAPKWTTARTITLTGDVTSSGVSLDGSANISIATTVASAGTAPKHYAGDVGSGTAVVITHNLNSRDVTVDVYRNSTPWDSVECDVERTSVNTITLRFSVSVTAAAYRVVVVGR